VWGIPNRHRDRTVDVCVRKLRDKIDRRPGAYTYIQTHYGVGYRFDPLPKPTGDRQPAALAVASHL
jgi:DNA-binding response OmpR family regulator